MQTKFYRARQQQRMIASLAERMRDWISENIQADKYDYKSKSGRQQSYKDFFIFHKEHDPELNEKSVRSIHQPTLEKVWAELERDVTEIKNTPRIKATKPAYDSTLNNDPNNKGMTADPKPQKQVIEAGTEPLGGAANNTLVDHSADSVGSFFSGMWGMAQIYYVELPDMTEEKRLKLGNSFLPFFRQYFPTEGKLFTAMSIMSGIFIMMPEIQECRRKRAENKANKEKISAKNPNETPTEPKTIVEKITQKRTDGTDAPKD